MTQAKTAFTTYTAIIVIAASVVNLWGCCECASAADQPAGSATVINYQSQTHLFPAGQGTAPFLVEQKTTNKTTATAKSKPSVAPKYYPTLLSMAPVGIASDETVESATNPLATQDTASSDTDEFQLNNQPSITDLADTLQWSILLMTAVAAAVMGVHRLTKNKQKTQVSQRMEYQGCLPVRGQFSMHLVTIIDRQFLVTTDRTGVKNVNALSEWDQFSTPIDQSEDDQFPDLSMEAKSRHHG